MSDRQNSVSEVRTKFGTFSGVFTPCTLTILGVILFLRFGQVVGNAGVLQTIAIILLAKGITFLTALSLSAIATNTKVKGGGAYYMISRSLGIEIGGAVGLVLYLAQAIAVAMYVVGFTEAFLDSFAGIHLSPLVVGTIVNGLIFLCVYVGAGWALRIQYAILAALVISLLSFFFGVAPELSIDNLQANWSPHYSDGASFLTMFALFFPAVTGIMAGANMSGDLRNPARAIPKGTLASIAVTGAVYFGVALLLGAALPSEELIADSLIMKRSALFPSLVTLGIFAATLSSALSSMMGAPRILQAFARDDVLKSLRIFATGSGKNDEPRRAIIFTFIVSQLAVLLGDLNVIAPIITMAFLITYGLINLATFYEWIGRNPSFRPRFRFSHWSASLLGAIGCLAVMILMAPLKAAVSLLVIFFLYRYLARHEVQERWGDVRGGLAFERARRNLLALEDEYYHPKNWRPILLALSGSAGQRVHLAIYGHWLTAGHGILILGQVIPGDLDAQVDRQIKHDRMLREFISSQRLSAFPAVVVTQDVAEGIRWMVHTSGLGSFRPNTVMLGWPRSSNDPENQKNFGAMVRTVVGLRRSVLAMRFLQESEDPWQAPTGTIDVWWRGEGNGTLMLLLAHLLVQNESWRSRPLRLLRIIENEAGREEALGHLRQLLVMARIEATAKIVVTPDALAAIQEESKDAALVFLGFEPPAEGEERQFFTSMEKIAGNLPRVIYVHSTGGVSLES